MDAVSPDQTRFSPESSPVINVAHVVFRLSFAGPKLSKPKSLKDRSTPIPLSLDYDYALLELKHPVEQKHKELGVAPPLLPRTQIHFSGYDIDKSLSEWSRDEMVVYRFCSVMKEFDDLMYQHCDAQPGAMGAGVYIRLRKKPKHRGGKWNWQRKVIGVFSGHKWVELDRGEHMDFNVTVRITPHKYAQICHWIHGDSGFCNEV